MNFIILIIFLIVAIEIIIKSKYFFLVNSLICLFKKANKVILSERISDNWKEKVIPQYSLRMFKYSLTMLLIFSVIIILFFIAGKLNVDFINLVFSIKGIVWSILFGFGYLYIKNLLKK
tara:strand:+ start:74 stop:430 length:357 start_codon:yes stop_codon:yes gene_type:complete